MAVDMFLKLAKVEGESTDDKHAGQIDILSWSFGSSQAGASHSGGGSGIGKVQIQDLRIVKNVDRSSPLLFSLCCKGEHIETGELIVRKSGGKSPLEYVKVSLDKVFVTSYVVNGAKGDAALSEEVSLSFKKCKIEYTPQKDDGSGGPKVIKGWDISANKEWT
jgi:type VI secretion system secreted protein Hcp